MDDDVVKRLAEKTGVDEKRIRELDKLATVHAIVTRKLCKAAIELADKIFDDEDSNEGRYTFAQTFLAGGIAMANFGGQKDFANSFAGLLNALGKDKEAAWDNLKAISEGEYDKLSSIVKAKLDPNGKLAEALKAHDPSLMVPDDFKAPKGVVLPNDKTIN